MAPLEPGQQLDHYRIDALVARSGMATIFRATDLGSSGNRGAIVAIKVPHPEIEADPALFDRFHREAAIGRELDHPAVMRVLPEEKRSRVYMVMEWVEGRSLRRILDEEGCLDEARAVRIAIAVCDALDHIHSRGIVHRDLKPENVMIAPNSAGGESIKLIDFGIAVKKGGRRLTFGNFSKISGTADYAAPERIRGKRGDARTDIYALGTMLYEMLHGGPPFEGPNAMVVLNRHLSQEAPRLDTFDPQVARIVAKTLERDPSRRYATAFEFALDLERPDQAMFHESLSKAPASEATRKNQALFYSGVLAIPTAVLALLLLFAHYQ